MKRVAFGVASPFYRGTGRRRTPFIIVQFYSRGRTSYKYLITYVDARFLLSVPHLRIEKVVAQSSASGKSIGYSAGYYAERKGVRRNEHLTSCE